MKRRADKKYTGLVVLLAILGAIYVVTRSQVSPLGGYMEIRGDISRQDELMPSINRFGGRSRDLVVAPPTIPPVPPVRDPFESQRTRHFEGMNPPSYVPPVRDPFESRRTKNFNGRSLPSHVPMVRDPFESRRTRNFNGRSLPSYAPLVRDPFESARMAPGGVTLDPNISALDVLGNLRGAVLERGTGRMILLASHNVAAPAASPEEWWVALRAARENDPPRFSLDPADPRNPSGPWQKCVYYGPIEDTSVGLVMYEADVLIKKLALGMVEAGTPGFKNLFDLLFAQPQFSRGTSYTRFWIVCESVNILRSDDALVFGRPRMRVCTERMYRTEHGLESSGGKEDPAAAKLAAWLTQHYDELARKHKCLADLRRIANIIALAKWVVAQGADLSMETLLPPSYQAVDTPETFQTLTKKQSRTSKSVTNTSRGQMIRTVTKQITLIGGVDLTILLPASTNAPEARKLAAAAHTWATQLPGRQAAAFRTQYDNSQVVGVVVPAA